ncbi:MAG: hypothetical protein M2R45_01496 [Verrucomicrobia subdivision 3 bacterium]|nr:hypothetical protein [Limisphaerales bacterium]MCS1413374.1 hypothetical protein [Limisphaerales bacterium]
MGNICPASTSSTSVATARRFQRFRWQAIFVQDVSASLAGKVEVGFQCLMDPSGHGALETVDQQIHSGGHANHNKQTGSSESVSTAGTAKLAGSVADQGGMGPSVSEKPRGREKDGRSPCLGTDQPSKRNQALRSVWWLALNDLSSRFPSDV